jgi:hypothetical protein
MLAALVVVVALAPSHAANDAALLVGLLGLIAFGARWLLRDLRVHPANFPPQRR